MVGEESVYFIGYIEATFKHEIQLWYRIPYEKMPNPKFLKIGVVILLYSQFSPKKILSDLKDPRRLISSPCCYKP